MRLGLGRTLGLCLLAAVMTSALDVSSHVDAADCSCNTVGRACDCAGRVLGVGWSDGYHACKSSGRHCIADLPPQSYVAYQQHRAALRAKSCKKQNACSTVYDHFDAGCGSCCDGGCKITGGQCACDGQCAAENSPACDLGCDAVCDGTLEISPSDMQPVPFGDAVEPSPETESNASRQSADFDAAANQTPPEAMFRRFVATATPKTIVPVHPYQQQVATPRASASSQGDAVRVQRRSNRGAAARVYPTLVAPPRAEREVSREPGSQPALRQFDRAGASNTQPAGSRTRLHVPESLKTYSTVSEIEGRTARALRSDVPALPKWVTDAVEDVRPMPLRVARQGRGVSAQRNTGTPVLELANRPSYPVDNVIRQPDFQR
ncbi:MAG: hypothetical protein GY924_22710 [Planctomycetaceae bacterium]|nr:hypothetical protein [Planctomycetaceae bacterium]